MDEQNVFRKDIPADIICNALDVINNALAIIAGKAYQSTQADYEWSFACLAENIGKLYKSLYSRSRSSEREEVRNEI